MYFPSYIEYYLIEKIDKETGEKIITSSNIPIDKKIQALAKTLYKTYINSGKFKYELKDKIKKMRESGAPDEDIEDAQEMGDDQVTKMETSVDEIEQQMIALAGDNTKLANKAEIWAGEAKTLAAKQLQKFYMKRAEEYAKETKNTQNKKHEINKDDKE